MKKILFLFSGSGLRYPFHAGVFAAARQAYPDGFDARFIGVSGGAVAAAALSGGMTPAEILDATLQDVAEDYRNLLTDGAIVDSDSLEARLIIHALGLRISDVLYLLFPKGGEKLAGEIWDRVKEKPLFGTMEKVEALLQKWLSNGSNYFLPFGAVATNLETNRPHILKVASREEIVPAVLASSAIPGIFPAQKIGNTYFSDGAVTDRFGFFAVDEMIKVWGWENEEVELIISDARAPIMPFNNPLSTVANIERAYDAATDVRHPVKFEFSKITTVKNIPYSPGAYKISAEELKQSFEIGFAEGVQNLHE